MIAMAVAGAKRRVRLAVGDEGFSMVELVVAMMILGVILVLLAAVQISAAITVTEARKMQQATAFANEAAEQMHSIPWNTLSKGMYSGFLAASGGDPLVSAGTLRIPSNDPLLPDSVVPLVIAPAASDQDLTNPARPLFDELGSHTQHRDDPSLVGVDFTIKAYVTDPRGGPADGAVGIVVVVEWPGRNGDTSRTTVWSEAYRGSIDSCGNPDFQPFLAACQSFFDASSNTGNVSASVEAISGGVPVPLMFPTITNEYFAGMRSAGALASMHSQQVNYADGTIQFGGNTVDDGDPVTSSIEEGFATHTSKATDDTTNQSGWLPTAHLSVTQSALDEDGLTVDTGGNPIDVLTRSDYARTGVVDGSMDGSCLAGIPAGQPCVKATLYNGSSLNSGSGYLWVQEPTGRTFRLSRRLNEGLGSEAGNFETAWAARFTSDEGTAAVGCTTLTGAGCVSAGATRTMANLSIGWVSGGWTGVATEGMAILKGDTTCLGEASGPYYGEVVRVQRGASQKAVAPYYSRCGKVRYWNGSGYEEKQVTNDSWLTAVTTAPVTWTGGDLTVVGTTQIQVVGAYWDPTSPVDPACKAEACTVSVSAGTILFTSTYDITWLTYTYTLIASTVVTSPSAQASYTAATNE